jgi:hypothetical protein
MQFNFGPSGAGAGDQVDFGWPSGDRRGAGGGIGMGGREIRSRVAPTNPHQGGIFFQDKNLTLRML